MSAPADEAAVAGLDAWRDLPRRHQPAWPDEADLARVADELASLPPLVFAGEADVLTTHLAAAGRGEA
ncbi:MAG: 3-deoxy-7-phosphoheptulonate synthase, partial [Actinotalea sp.]|nr:3-deoxy-7-phosphoheptulonate synthase [Actinotalea sp.]